MQSPMRRVKKALRDLTSERQRLAYAKAKQRFAEMTQSRGPAVEIVRGWNAGGWARQTALDVGAALASHGVSFVRLPQSDVFDTILVVKESDASAVAEALGGLDPEQGWNVVEHGRPRYLRFARERQMPGLRGEGPLEYVVSREARAGQRGLNTAREAVIVQLWSEVTTGSDRADGDPYLAGTIHRHPAHAETRVAYFDPEAWERYAGTTIDHVQWPPLMDEIREPIDVVYTWVDGNDPAWLARKAAATDGADLSEINSTATVASRFADRNELKYSLRSLEMYAPWVNHVYVVTDQQRPDWLVDAHPRLTIVDHKDIFTDPSVLPVYNSHAIESQLHHIPGLSDRYLYLNDDMIFARPVSPSIWFEPGGLTKFFLSKAVLDVNPPSSRDLPVLSSAKMNRQRVLEQYGRWVTQKFKHTPHAQRRDVLEDLEATLPEDFRRTAASRLRHPDDLSVPSALHHYWAQSTGRAHEGKIRYDYFDTGTPGVAARLERLATREDLDVFCINDSGEQTPPALAEVLERVLSERYPVPSSFERP